MSIKLKIELIVWNEFIHLKILKISISANFF